jgi:N-acetylglucosamine-6-phosphate deacetylase
MGMLMTGGRVVTPDGVLDPGWIRLEGATIAEIGTSTRGETGADALELAGRWVVPGFIDLHCHGGGGHSMLSADPAEIRATVSFHRAHGTTRTLASLVTAPIEELLAGLAAVRQAMESDDGIAGAHLEGPFLSPSRAGAHDPRHLLPPDPATFDRLLDAAGGALRVITVAPELPGAMDLVRMAVEAGVVVAIGHSDADYGQAMEAFDAGATLVTHLFNAMRPWHHRQPSLVGAALARPTVACELINDGFHLHDATVTTAMRAAGSDRVAFITDAIPATGLGDGVHRLGPATVRVSAGAARLGDGYTLAGSTLTMDAALRRSGRDQRTPMESIAEACSTTPARVLGIGDTVGSIAPGLAADLVVLSDALEVEAVMVAGEWTGSGRLFNR